MELRWLLLLSLSCLLLTWTDAVPLISPEDDTTSAAFAMVSETAGAITKQMGWSRDELKISKIDTVDAKMGEAVVYQFDIQVGDTVLPPLVFAEEITGWKYLIDEPYKEKQQDSEQQPWGMEKVVKGSEEDSKPPIPILAPFELAGPVDLWISDGKQMRLALPHDVEAGVLNRVLLADGAVVRVQGAREVSLSRPIQLPLPLVGTLGEGLLDLASRLRVTSKMGDKPILSLRVVGPSSLVAGPVQESDDGGSTGLRAKLLAPGSVELTSKQPAPSKPSSVPEPSLRLRDSLLWPFPSVNSSNDKIVALEQALVGVLGPKAYKTGSFNLLEAKATAASFVQFDFELEKSLDNTSRPEQWPEWLTVPSVQRFQFHALARIEGQKLVPIRVLQLEPVRSSVSFQAAELAGNVSYSKMSTFVPPPGPMTLDFDWAV